MFSNSYKNSHNGKKRTTVRLFTPLLAVVLGLTLALPMSAQAADGKPVVRLTTTMGNIDIELSPERAPRTVENFLTLVDNGFYDGLIFHRVVAGFVIQAGGYEADLTYRTPPATVMNESLYGLKNKKYSVAMARLTDPDSADTQFFINVRHNPSLDADGTKPGYTVFGQVIGGMDVVTAIELVDTHREGGMAGVPEQDVVINSAVRL